MRKLTDREFKNRVYSLVGDEYQILSPYIKSSAKVRVKHVKCGYEWEVEASSFLRGTRCPLCANQVVTGTSFAQHVKILTKGEYEMVNSSSYVNNRTKVEIRHKKCGNIWGIKTVDFNRGYRCPKCAHKQDPKIFSNWFRKIYGKDYEMISSYVTSRKSIKIRHRVCGTEFTVYNSNVKARRIKCPVCNGSLGEQLISAYLKKNNLSFTPQKVFSDCRYRRELPFDFFL